MINDCAFILADGDYPAAAKIVLEQVVRLAPNRIVAWLNLADVKWELEDPSADDDYATYIRLMTEAGKQNDIVPRVLPRTTGK